MCDFISWLQDKQGNVLFLTDALIQKWERENHEKLDPEDIVGHGAIEAVFELPYRRLEHLECCDFSDPDKFPVPVAIAFLKGEMNDMLRAACEESTISTKRLYFDLFGLKRELITLDSFKFDFTDVPEEDQEKIITAFKEVLATLNSSNIFAHSLFEDYPCSLDQLLSWDRTPQGFDFWSELENRYGDQVQVTNVKRNELDEINIDSIIKGIRTQTGLNPKWQTFITAHNL